MRDIKFRAWDNYGQEMLEVVCIDFARKYVYVRFLWPIQRVQPLLSDEVTLMQFTGLCDRNGQEIYEGDILCAIPGALYEIYWDTQALAWMARIRSGTCFLREMDLRLYEITGNIYKSRGLLQRAQE